MSKKKTKKIPKPASIESKELAKKRQEEGRERKRLAAEQELRDKAAAMSVSLPAKVIRWALLAYLFIILTLSPMYVQNAFNDIGTAKFTFFRSVTFGLVEDPFTMRIPGFLPVLIALWVWYAVVAWKKGVFRQVFSPKKLIITDWLVIAFMALTVISTIFAVSPTVTLWGFPGWFMGMAPLLAFCLIYFFVSRFLRDKCYLYFAIGCGMISLLYTGIIAILNRFSIDIMGIYEVTWPGIFEKTLKRTQVSYLTGGFLTTVGNQSWYATWLVLVVPMAIYLMWGFRKWWVRLLGVICTAVGAMTLIVADSGNGIIGLALMLLIFFLCSFRSWENLLRFLEVIAVMLSSWQLLRIIDMTRTKGYQLQFGESLPDYLVHGSLMPWLTLAVLLVLAFILWKTKSAGKKTPRTAAARQDASRVKNTGAPSPQEVNASAGTNGAQITDAMAGSDAPHTDPLLTKLRRGSRIATLAAVCLFALYLALNTAGVLPKPLSSSSKYLVLDRNWGHYRAWIWEVSVRSFAETIAKDPLRLWIGMGPDNYYLIFNDLSEAMNVDWMELAEELGVEITESGSTYLSNAHNEWLNVLFNMGLPAAIVYLGAFLSVVIGCFRRALKEPLAAMLSAAIAAYIVNTAVSYQQINGAAPSFILLGFGAGLMASIAAARKPKPKKEKTQPAHVTQGA